MRLHERGRLNHAYILFGPRGAGKARFAKQFAAYLENNAWSEEQTRPLTDMLEVGPNEVGTIGIEAARAIKYFLSERPLVSSRRTVIIHHAGALTTEAQNALLKTAEEPPESGLLFFIVQDPELLMPTLLSRMQKIYVPMKEDAYESMRKIKGGANEIAAREFMDTLPAARKEFVKALVEPEDFSFRGFLDGMINVLSREKKPHSALWHAVLELRGMADATGLNPRLQLMYLGTLLG